MTTAIVRSCKSFKYLPLKLCIATIGSRAEFWMVEIANGFVISCPSWNSGLATQHFDAVMINANSNYLQQLGVMESHLMLSVGGIVHQSQTLVIYCSLHDWDASYEQAM